MSPVPAPFSGSSPSVSPPDADLFARSDHRLGPLERLSRWILRRAGWRATGVYPRLPRFVLIVAPHTSNWDFPVSLLAGWGIGLLRDYPHGFLMKDSLDRWPFRPVMRRLGGIPVARTHPEHSVARAAASFSGKERFLLALAPEGTRKPTRYWRSGFWHIARRAGVPVVPVALDFGRRELRIGEAVPLSGDAEEDMAGFREFFEGAQGFTAEYASPIELAPEKTAG
jgi:1-acyl-sn-glycerol-3-phosphate acyltransferase